MADLRRPPAVDLKPSSTVSVVCPCSRSYTLKVNMVGKKFKCKECGKVIKVGSIEGAPAPAPDKKKRRPPPKKANPNRSPPPRGPPSSGPPSGGPSYNTSQSNPGTHKRSPPPRKSTAPGTSPPTTKVGPLRPRIHERLVERAARAPPPRASTSGGSLARGPASAGPRTTVPPPPPPTAAMKTRKSSSSARKQSAPDDDTSDGEDLLAAHQRNLQMGRTPPPGPPPDDDDEEEWQPDEQLASYRPRVTIYERQEFRSFTGPECAMPGCARGAEIQGKCVQHAYAPPTTPHSRVGPPGMIPGPPPQQQQQQQTFQFTGPPPPQQQQQQHQSGPSSGKKARDPVKDQREREQLADELVSTEKTYLKGLKSVSKGMILRLEAYEKMNKPLCSRMDIGNMFLTIGDIFDLNNRLYQELKRLQHSGRLLTEDLPATLLTYTPFFKMYTLYVNKYDDAIKAIKEMRKRPDFDSFMTHCEIVEGGNVESFMIMPVQRIPRYLMLIKGIIKHLAPSDPMHPGLSKALNEVSKVAAEINSSFSKREARARVVEVQSHVEGVPDLVTPTRWHIKDGPLSKKYNKKGLHLNSYKVYWFFLFNDLIMYTTVPAKSGNCKLKYRMPLLDTKTIDLPDEPGNGQKNRFQIQSDSVKSFVVAAPTKEEKLEWMRLLNENIGSTLQNAATLRTATTTSSGPTRQAGMAPVRKASSPGMPRASAPVGMGMPQLPINLQAELKGRHSMQTQQTPPPPRR